MTIDCLNNNERKSLSEYLNRIIDELEKQLQEGYVSSISF